MARAQPPPLAARLRAHRQRKGGTVVVARFRTVLLTLVTLYFAVKTFSRQLFPWGYPVPWSGRDEYGTLDHGNDLLQAKHGKLRKIRQRRRREDQDHENATTTITAASSADGHKKKKTRKLIAGTETMVFDAKGDMYAMNQYGQLIRVEDVRGDDDGSSSNATTATADVTAIRRLGRGRVLSGRFADDGTLWMADAVLGLTRLRDPSDPRSKVELVADAVVVVDNTDDDAKDEDTSRPSPLRFVDDLDIGPRTGRIYFTDATDVEATRPVAGRTTWWDVWYPSKVECLRGTPTGRLLSYDPVTDVTRVLASGFRFANGVAVSSDESYLLMTETFGMRVWKYHIRGPHAGEMRVLVSRLPGYPDGVSCAHDGGGGGGDDRCFVVMPVSVIPFHKLVAALPDALDVLLRGLMMALPRWMAPVRCVRRRIALERRTR